MQYKSTTTTAFLIAALFIGSLYLNGCNTDDSGYDDILGRKIAVYNGYGAWDSSAVAIKNCLEERGWDVVLVNEDSVQHSLDSIGLVVIGAGNPLDILNGLGFTGRERIRNMVWRGGSYIGLGAGAFIAGDSIVFNQFPSIETPIGLYRGYAAGPLGTIAYLPNYAMTIVNLNVDVLNPTGIPSISVLYYGGPTMIIYSPIDAESIGRFNVDDSFVGWKFRHGSGRVVLCSVQPEIEEDSNRDGSDWGDNLNDGESDWFWLQNMADWCLENVPVQK